MRTLLRRLTKLFLLALNAIWAIPVVVFIRLIRPWAHVRMGVLESSRIGHFVLDASTFLVRQSLQPPSERTFDLFGFSRQACNKQWARMVRRKLCVRWWVRCLAYFNRLLPCGASHDLCNSTDMLNWDNYSIFQRSPARFEFTPEEDAAARTWLRRRGWREGEKFVCLLMRDSAYLGGSDLWNYHDYRNSDIDTYVKAVQALVDRGYWVVRLGKVMHKRLPLHHPRVIDYPFVEDQDDLVDIWLSANCYFFISTATGIDVAPLIYGRPVVFVNALPLGYATSSSNNIWVPKHLYWGASGNPLTLEEHCQHAYCHTERYEQAGIVIKDLSPEDIAAAVLECEERTTGTWIGTKESEDCQRRFWDSLRKWPDFHKFHGDIHPEARPGSAWLKSMREVFVD